MTPSYLGSLTINASNEPLVDIIMSIILTKVIPVAAGVAVLFIIYGGVLLITSQGNADKVTQARKIIQNSVIGILIIAFSFVIVLTVQQVLINNILK